ncbi:odorant receptor 23a [Drosophila ananassae]|uniref:odorant receptor 23a n=1 Tax=Drosophila ananassae TaxID=7217 RepID=UPI0013A5CD82|nr:odorant receptor 23a [Drosophila ananassae]
MEILGKSYFCDQRLAWRVLGAQDLSEGHFRGWAMAFHFLVALAFPMLALSLFSYDSTLENITNFSLTITSLATIVKFGLYTRRLSNLAEMENIIAEMDKRVAGLEQRSCHRLMKKRLHFLSRGFLLISCIVIVSLQMSFLFKDKRSLPYPSWFPLDWTSSWSSYIVAVAYQQLVVFVQVFQNYVGDSFPPLALFLIAQQCQLLNLRISGIGFQGESLQANEAELRECIKDQKQLYRLLDLSRSVITWPMFVQFIVIAINVGVTVFGLVFYVETVYDRIYYVSFLIGLTLETYPLCFYGTNMENSFHELHYAAFRCNWVEQSRSFRSTMLILSERTKMNQLLLAGGLVPIHLSTFQATCKAAYSFFTLMSNTMKQET